MPRHLTEIKICEECGEEIFNRKRSARFCKECAEIRMQKYRIKYSLEYKKRLQGKI